MPLLKVLILEGKSIEDILTGLDMSNGAVRNNGGGFYNHSLFWSVYYHQTVVVSLVEN